MDEAEEKAEEEVETARGKKGLFSRGAKRLGLGTGRGFTTEVIAVNVRTIEYAKI